MIVSTLTPNAEKLLQEILSHRLDNGNCDTDYWAKQFEGRTFAEVSQLRSIFKELSDEEMISVRWSGDGPYILVVLNNGLSYFEIKKENEKSEQREKRLGRFHDIFLIIIGALIGGIVEFLLFKLFGIGG